MPDWMAKLLADLEEEEEEEKDEEESNIKIPKFPRRTTACSRKKTSKSVLVSFLLCFVS